LKESLRRRGYPTMPDIVYDTQKRAGLLEKLKQRDNLVEKVPASPIMAMKVEYAKGVEDLRLRHSLRRLVAELQAELGREFLNGTRIVIAYTVQRNMFARTYNMNFLPHTRRVCMAEVGKRVEGFCV